jgi:predicted homoserine dehydrogenase-like protein
MMIIDSALQRHTERGRAVNIGLFGAGFLGRPLARHILQCIPGLRLAAVCSRTVEGARRAYTDAGIAGIEVVSSIAALDAAALRGRAVVVEDPALLAESNAIDVIMDVTGTIEEASRVAVKAFAHGKHFVTNAELDATLGPVLKSYADRAGVVYTSIDGDQPGTQMNLYRFVRSIGLKPLVCGNIKGLQDHYRTPDTQREFAARWGFRPSMATQFADGTKISFEQASIANATGMRVSVRGMLGQRHDGHVDDLAGMYAIDRLRAWGGIVDYVLGAKPSPGVFILAESPDPAQAHYLSLFKLGDGPLYNFYVPYHLSHLEAPYAAARAALFHDAVIAPAGMHVEVVATAKRNLKVGETLDGIGGFCLYGQCENSDAARAESLLPMGLAEGCRMVRDVPRDRVLTVADVIVPAGRTCDYLWSEQTSQHTLAAGVAAD